MGSARDSISLFRVVRFLMCGCSSIAEKLIQTPKVSLARVGLKMSG